LAMAPAVPVMPISPTPLMRIHVGVGLLNQNGLEAKFRDCARNAVRPLSDASVDGLLAAIGRLETFPDARELMAAVAG
jgi:hypothetical protein